MSKYAITVPCSAGYTYGLNALLNGLDYFDNTADVHILWYGDPEEETNRIVKDFLAKLNTNPFIFKTVLFNMHEWLKSFNPLQDAIWQMTYARWL